MIVYSFVCGKVLADGNLVLVVDAAASERVCHVFDIASKNLTECKIADKRFPYAAGALVSGVPLICGGMDYYGPIRDCYAYDRVANRWNFVAGMRIERGSHAAVSISQRLWVSGGYIGSITTARTEFVHLNGMVERGPDLPFATADHCMVTLHDGRVMVLGGQGNKRVVIFDPRSNTFTDVPTLECRGFL